MNNKGMTLIEIVIVIAIIAIVGTSAFVGVESISSQNVSSVASEINSNLAKARLESLSKSACYLHITADDKGDYYLLFNSSSTVGSDIGTKIGSRKLNISYVTNAGVTKIDSEDSIAIYFDRTSGKVTYYDDSASPMEISGVKGLKIDDGKKERNVIIVSNTGKHYVKETQSVSE